MTRMSWQRTLVCLVPPADITMKALKLIFLSMGILPVAASPLWAQQVLINEILYDTPGPDNSSQLFTELWGPPGSRLSGWTLVGISGSTGVAYRTVQLSGTIPEDGYFVVANCGDSSCVDLNLDLGCGPVGDVGVNWLNAGGPSGDDCDGIELRHGTELMDRVCYGLCAPGHLCTGEGGTNAPDAYPVGDASYSLARCPDHEDTDNNGADWVITPPTPGRANQCPCQPHHYPIRQIQEDEADGTPVHEDEFVSARGIATIANGVLDPQATDFYIQDSEAGINIFGAFDPVTVVPGDCVIVEGWVAHTCGLSQIVSSGPGICFPIIEVAGHAEVPEPVQVNCHAIGSLGEGYEGTLARLECVTIVGGDPWPTEGEDADITVADGSGLCTIHIDKDTDIDGQPEPEWPRAVVGIVGQYDCTPPFTAQYYLVPRAYSHISICSDGADLPRRTPQDFRLLACWPNPFNATTRIAFTVAHPAVVSVRVFDLLGRQITKASVPTSSPGEYSYTWDGTDLAGETVAAGLYFVQLKAGSKIAVGKLLFLK